MQRRFLRSEKRSGIGAALGLADPGSLVELADVGLSYPGRPPLRALEGVSISMQQGQFVSLIGPSGCGKSTLLRIVAGILDPTSGSVLVEGDSPITAQRAHRFGFVFQDPVLLPWRTVQENVELLTELVGLPANERRSRAKESWNWWGSAGAKTSGLTSCRVACDSESPSRGRSPWNRRSCSWTSPSRLWTSSSGSS